MISASAPLFSVQTLEFGRHQGCSSCVSLLSAIRDQVHSVSLFSQPSEFGWGDQAQGGERHLWLDVGLSRCPAEVLSFDPQARLYPNGI